MEVKDLSAGELIQTLITVSRKSILCKGSADQLKSTIEELLPVIQEIKHSGVDTRHLLSQTLKEGMELCEEVEKSGRWSMYKKLMLAGKMDKLTKRVSRLLRAHMLADVHHIVEKLDRLERHLGSMKIGGGGWNLEMEELESGNLMGMGIALGKKKVKEMVVEREDLGVVGISGIGGSGKTTLAAEVCRDGQVLSYFSNRILFLTVSQSPDVQQLRARIWGFISGGCYDGMPQNWNPQFHCKTVTRCLVVLDDVWSLSVLRQLIFEVSGYKTLVVSRFEFRTAVNASYKVELLREDESMLLFCHSAFGQRTIPPPANVTLVKQIVNECKGLPLALKEIGASFRGQPEMYWKGAQKRLSRGEPISECHESMLDRMAISIKYLPERVKQCFLDLASFPQDKKIPVEMIINMWVEVHDIDAEEAFAILVELAERNLLNLVKDAGAGDLHNSYYEISVTQHDVMRDVNLHLSNQGNINERKRLLMPKLGTRLPKEWERHVDQPFDAQIVSVHVGEMSEMDWFRMEFPKAEVLILNFSSKKFFLPHFIKNMPKLRALIIKNCSTFVATLHNLSVCSNLTNLTNLRSLWLEKVSQLPEFTAPMKKMQKISLVMCRLNNSLDQPAMDLSQMFPCLLELTIDHCHDLSKLPTSICKMQSLECLSITNCHRLLELPADIGMLRSLQILRLYACPLLRTLPSGTSKLVDLRYLNISQCVMLTCLPQGIGKLVRLEKIDMRECLMIHDLPESVPSLQSLQHVICDEEVFQLWKDMVKATSEVHVEVPEKCFNLNWLHECS